MKVSRILSLIILPIAFLAITQTVFAQNLPVAKPNFPECKTPQGELKVFYPEGTHGIVGDPSTFTGSDSVYILSDATLSQCFCADHGRQGIQTNWWKVSSLTFEELETLKKEGWIFVPDGSLWGLEAAPYMAQNTTYKCGTHNDGGDDDNDDNDDDDDDDNDGDVLGTLTSIGGQVLGLAATGNWLDITLLGTAGVVSLGTAAFLLKKKAKNETNSK
jgi:hypothetical protein